VRFFRGRARHIGWLFVVATVAGVASVALLAPIFGEQDLLAAVQSNQGALILGEMLIFAMLTAMAGTAVLLYPILNEHSETLALGYVVARTLEVAMLAIGLLAGFLLLPLSWSVAGQGVDLPSAQVVAESLAAASDWSGYLGAQMIFSISALVLNLAFLRNGLIPRWLAIWGLIGVPLMFASGLLVMFESLAANAVALNLLVVPLAVQEMVMAVWLIVKGFRSVADGPPGERIQDPEATGRKAARLGHEQQRATGRGGDRLAQSSEGSSPGNRSVSRGARQISRSAR